MKHKKISREKKPPGASPDLNRNEDDFAPAPKPDEASLSHVNQGLSQGHEVRHWLEGEAKWLAERRLPHVQVFTIKNKIINREIAF